MSGHIVNLMRDARRSYADALAREQADTLRRAHVAAEGSGPVNENPDGCYYCGSSQHHTGDCDDSQHDIGSAAV